jgi:hypothetical protein
VEASAGAYVFLHPLWAGHASFAYLNRAGPVEPLDGSATLVVHARDRPVIVAFPAEQDAAAGEAANMLTGTATRTETVDAKGAPLLSEFRVEPASWGDMAPPRDARLEPEEWVGAEFASSVRLVGATISGAGPTDPDGGAGPTDLDGGAADRLAVDIWWEALAPIDADYTVFVHVEDAGGAPVGQVDREPGKASYRTSSWRPGDLVLERYEVDVRADARGPLTVRTGWYDAASGRRLSVARRAGGATVAQDGTAIELGPVQWDPRGR